MVKRHRHRLKRFFVNDKENQAIMANVAKSPYSDFSTYARQVLTSSKQQVVIVNQDSYHLLIAELKRIGNNINQLAKVANESESVDKESFQALQVLFQEMVEEVQKEFHLKVRQVEKR